MDRCESGCGRHAITWWDDDTNRAWLLCGPCSDRHADALTRQGWQQIVDERDALEVAG